MPADVMRKQRYILIRRFAAHLVKQNQKVVLSGNHINNSSAIHALKFEDPRRFTAASAADNRSGSMEAEMRRFVIHSPYHRATVVICR